MSFISVFDVLGPNMIGPSSSHTAGTAIIAFLAHKMIGAPITEVEFTLYGSFAKTYRGHGTDRALLGGIMGFTPDDTRIRDSFHIADERGLSYRFLINETETDIYPNTADIRMTNSAGQVMTVRGESLGGGKVRIVRINQVKVDFSGEYSAVIVIHQDKPGVAAHITKCLSDRNVNIAFMRLFRESKGHTAYTIVESDNRLPEHITESLRENTHVYDVMVIQSQNEQFEPVERIDDTEPTTELIDFKNAKELLQLCSSQQLPISEVMRRRECELAETTRKAVNSRMKRALEIMKASAKEPIKNPGKSMGGLIGGEAKKLSVHQDNGKGICGSILSRGITYAMAVLEVNASMGLIVAAPTAGSSGILPGLLLSLQEEYELPDDRIIDAMFTAGAIGCLAMRNATVAGAVGGCQAEVGTAAAMAAAAAVELMQGTPEQCLDAASAVLMNMLGLVCDPVGGLVEYPCQNRNASGVANALIAAELSLSGIRQLIPLDEMIASMYEVGRRLPSELRETALGGCAATPTGCSLCPHS